MDADERLQSLVFTFSKRLDVPGFDARINGFKTAEERREAEAKLQGAIALLRQHTPLRLAYLQTDLHRLLIFVASGALAMCYSRIRLCLFDDEYVLSNKTTATELALTLVHEGTHARLARFGYRYTDERRARIERLCYGAELVIARRLPGAASNVESLQRSIAARDAYYSRTVQRTRQLRQVARAINDLGWLGRVVFWLTVPLAWVMSIGKDRRTR